jgi:glucokinase
MSYAIGVDIGGTNTRIALVDNLGQTFSLFKSQTPKDYKKLLGLISDYIINNKNNYLGVGLAIACPVNTKTDKIRWSSKFNYPSSFNLGSRVRDICRKPVFVENDLNSLTSAEMLFGVLRNVNSAIAITISTGIGSGVVINKTLYKGKDNGAGEVGHTIIDLRSKMKCNLGHTGDWESLASAKALETMYYLETGDKFSAKEIVSMAKLNSLLAKKVLNKVVFHIGVGLSGVINSFAPEVIVICGDFFNEIWPMHKADIIKEVKARVVVPMPKFVKSRFGDKAGVIGAASLVFNS